MRRQKAIRAFIVLSTLFFFVFSEQAFSAHKVKTARYHLNTAQLQNYLSEKPSQNLFFSRFEKMIRLEKAEIEKENQKRQRLQTIKLRLLYNHAGLLADLLDVIGNRARIEWPEMRRKDGETLLILDLILRDDFTLEEIEEDIEKKIDAVELVRKEGERRDVDKGVLERQISRILTSLFGQSKTTNIDEEPERNVVKFRINHVTGDLVLLAKVFRKYDINISSLLPPQLNKRGEVSYYLEFEISDIARWKLIEIGSEIIFDRRLEILSEEKSLRDERDLGKLYRETFEDLEDESLENEDAFSKKKGNQLRGLDEEGEDKESRQLIRDRRLFGDEDSAAGSGIEELEEGFQDLEDAFREGLKSVLQKGLIRQDSEFEIPRELYNFFYSRDMALVDTIFEDELRAVLKNVKMPEEDQKKLKADLRLVEQEVSAKRKDRKTSSIWHLIGTVKILVKEVRMGHLNGLSVPLLHDILEDRIVTRKQLRSILQARGRDMSIPMMIEYLSRQGEKSYETEKRYFSRIIRAHYRKPKGMTREEVALMVLTKMADRIHNLRTANIGLADFPRKAFFEALNTFIPEFVDKIELSKIVSLKESEENFDYRSAFVRLRDTLKLEVLLLGIKNGFINSEGRISMTEFLEYRNTNTEFFDLNEMDVDTAVDVPPVLTETFYQDQIDGMMEYFGVVQAGYRYVHLLETEKESNGRFPGIYYYVNEVLSYVRASTSRIDSAFLMFLKEVADAYRVRPEKTPETLQSVFVDLHETGENRGSLLSVQQAFLFQNLMGRESEPRYFDMVFDLFQEPLQIIEDYYQESLKNDGSELIYRAA